MKPPFSPWSRFERNPIDLQVVILVLRAQYSFQFSPANRFAASSHRREISLTIGADSFSATFVTKQNPVFRLGH